MPTYVYKCDSCGTQFEQFQSFKDDPIRTCPACAGAVRRVFQPVGIVFKGSGWYITDSRKSSTATVSSDDTKSATNGASDASKPETSTAETSKTESAGESKPEATKTETSSASAPPSDTKSSASTSATA